MENQTNKRWDEAKAIRELNELRAQQPLSITTTQPDSMEKLSTIQKRNNLNAIYRTGEQGPGGAYHDYDIYPANCDPETTEIPLACIEFQKGPRNDPDARHGILDSDLLEIVRDRLKAFQDGPMATRENEIALQHIETALLWMAKRADDRAERNVLGTMIK